MRSLRIKIVSTTEVLWEGEAAQASIPGASGRIGILPARQPVLALLKEGIVNITGLDNKLAEVKIPQGFASFDSDIITICVDDKSPLANSL